MDALCPGPNNEGCAAYLAYRQVEQYWEAALNHQAEEEFKRADSLVFNSFIFLQVGGGAG